MAKTMDAAALSKVGRRLLMDLTVTKRGVRVRSLGRWRRAGAGCEEWTEASAKARRALEATLDAALRPAAPVFNVIATITRDGKRRHDEFCTGSPTAAKARREARAMARDDGDRILKMKVVQVA